MVAPLTPQHKQGVKDPKALKAIKIRPNKETPEYNPSLPLDNPKWEKFAFEYALLGNASLAYRQVYGVQADTAYANSSKLLSNASIRARVDFIQRAQTDKAFATIVASLEANKVIVHDADAVLTQVPDHQARISAATAALKSQGKWQESTQTTNNYTANVLAVNSVEDIKDVLGMISQMEADRAARRRPSGVIDVKNESGG